MKKVKKTAWTVPTGSLIRQDLEPVLTEIFARNFPGWKEYSANIVDVQLGDRSIRLHRGRDNGAQAIQDLLDHITEKK